MKTFIRYDYYTFLITEITVLEKRYSSIGYYEDCQESLKRNF